MARAPIDRSAARSAGRTSTRPAARTQGADSTATPRTPSTGPASVERRTRRRADKGAAQLLPAGWREAATGTGLRLSEGITEIWERFRYGGAGPLHHVPSELDHAPGVVRLRGVIEAGGGGFATPGSSRPAIFARTLFLHREQLGQPRSFADELRGVDFRIRLASGERVEVAAADVRLADPPAIVGTPNLDELARRGGEAGDPNALDPTPRVRESRLCEGDTIEVCGVLVREVKPGGQGAFGRGTPLVVRLAPPPGAKSLSVRRLPPR
ncbi:MAG TPA: hypothetical protein VGF45_24135 [Polyangia bacterium]